MKNPRIYCVMVYDEHKDQAYHDFYIKYENKDYFLFRQKYRKGIKEYFGYNGVTLTRAFKNHWNKLDTAVVRTIDKIPIYIRYIEKEYDLAILERTKKRRA